MNEWLHSSGKKAICSRCGHRCRGRYDKSIKRARDLTVTGYQMILKFEQ